VPGIPGLNRVAEALDATGRELRVNGPYGTMRARCEEKEESWREWMFFTMSNGREGVHRMQPLT
jgi:hypothetical protein